MESNLFVTGQITIGQDDNQVPLQGTIRFDTITNAFQGFDGATWVTLGSGAPGSNQTDTLEIGDSFGGGIVFHTVGSNGLVVIEFDLVLPNAPLVSDIQWGDPTIATGATSSDHGYQNTMEITDTLQNWSNGEYAAELCENLSFGGFEDWHLPSVAEFEMMNAAVGSGGSGPNNNLANLQGVVYWTSTEIDDNDAIYYHVGHQEGRVLTKDNNFKVRAIRAY